MPQYQVQKRKVRVEEDVTSAVEDYLVTIYRLEEVFGIARTTIIASELNVKPGTVSKVLSRLEMLGLVERTKYRGVKLTDKGRSIAEKIVWKHRVIERFLYDYVGLDPIKAHDYAHLMEHLPDEVVEKIYDKLGRPPTCPLGNPIPGSPIPNELKVAKPLSEADQASCVKVIRIAGVLKEGLKTILDLGLMVGSVLHIVYASQSHVVVDIVGKGRIVEVPSRYARMVYVVENDNC